MLAVFSATDVPVAINDHTTSVSSITIPESEDRVVDLTVTMDITHTWNGDLNIFLISPSGERVELSTFNGSSSQNFTNVTFDDASSRLISTQPGPYSGAYRPEGQLSVLRGDTVSGIWKLEVADRGSRDVGQLNTWSLDVQTDGHAIVDVRQEGGTSRNKSLETATVHFVGNIDPATVTRSDMSLTRNGEAIALGSDVLVAATDDPEVLQISGLSAYTGQRGDYRLTVDSAGIRGEGGEVVLGQATAAWTNEPSRLLGFLPVTPALRNTPVSEIDFRFTSPIDLNTLAPRHIQLRRDDELLPLGDSLTISPVGSAGRYRISGLTDATTPVGVYELTLLTNGIIDDEGSAATGRFATAEFEVSGPRVQRFNAVTPNNRNTAVETLDLVILFRPDMATLDFRDIQLRRNGTRVDLDSSVTIARVDETSVYRISGLADLTRPAGFYTVSVSGRGLRDDAGRVGSGSATTHWVVSGPGVRSIRYEGIPQRNTPLDSLDVVLAHAIVPESFDFSDLTLRRDSVVIPVDDSVTVTQVEGSNTYRIRGLSGFTSVPGTYSLRINAGRLTDADGRTGPSFSASSNIWFLDQTAPELQSMSEIRPNPRIGTARPVHSVDVRFSEALQSGSFTRSNLTLTRNGGPNLIDESVRVFNYWWSPREFIVSGLGALTREPGVYVLTVGGEFTDLAGNTATHTISRTWLAAEAPVIRMSSLMIYPEHSRPLIISGVARITDGDTQNYGGGTLTVAIQDSSTTNDRIGIYNWGHSNRHVATVGNQVRYQGTTIGTFSGGAGTPLVVRLNSEATLEAVEALIGTIHYSSTGSFLTNTTRSVRFTLTDSDGVTGQFQKRILILPVDDASQIEFEGPVAHNRNGSPTRLIPDAVLTDSDTTSFNYHVLRVQVRNGDGSEQLQVSGGFSIVGTELRLDGNVVGRVHADGTGRKPLIIRLGRTMSLSMTQRLLRSLTFATSENSSTATRSVDFSIGLSGGAVSPLRSLLVDVI